MLEKNKEAIALKREAVKLLTRYDKLRLEMRVLEHDLGRACVAYGKSIGVWGLTRDHLRIQLRMDAEGRSKSNGTNSRTKDHLRMQVEREKGKVA